MSTSRRATKVAAFAASALVTLGGLTVSGTSTAFAVAAPAPTRLAPGSSQSPLKNLELSWAPVAGATSYQVEVLDDDDPDAAVALKATTAIARWTVPVQLPNGEYRWRVRAMTAQGAGGWSPLSRFVRGWVGSSSGTVTTPGTLPVLQWSPIPDASFYEVEVSDRPFDEFVGVQTGRARSWICYTSHTTFAPYGVAAGQAMDQPVGDMGRCAFVADSKGDATDGSQPAPTATPTPSPSASPSATPTPSPTPDNSIGTKYKFGQTYFWRVRGRDGTVDKAATPFVKPSLACTGVWDDSDAIRAEGTVTVPLPSTPPEYAATPECSQWRLGDSFVPATPVVDLVRPTAPGGLRVGPAVGGGFSSSGATVVTDSPVFAWTPVANANKYRVYLSRTADFNDADIVWETQASTLAPISTLDLGGIGKYWTVQACGANIQCSPPAAMRRVSKATASTVQPLALRQAGGALLATWTTQDVGTGSPAPRAGAASYQVQLIETTTGAALPLVSTDRVASASEPGRSHLALPAATTPEGSYAFRVRGVDESGKFLPWSARSSTSVVDRTSPTVGLTSKAGFVDRAAVTLTFNEPVVNVSAATAGVVLSTGAKVRGTLTRRSGTAYSFVPAAPWVTGAYTRAWAAGVVDRAGKRAVASTRSARVGSTADSAGLALAFTAGDRGWSTRSSSDAYRATFRATSDDPRTAKRGSATATVYGSAVTVGFCRTPSSGSLRVYVDGRLRTTVSLYRGWTGCANAVRVAGLARGIHRVVLVPVATSRGSYAAVDRVSVS